MHDEVNLRQAPNVHRLTLLAQQQHLALLAATAAAEVETTGRYDLVNVVDGVVLGYLATHTGSVLDAAAERAADRVRTIAREWGTP
jgi:hypothetical protein